MLTKNRSNLWHKVSKALSRQNIAPLAVLYVQWKMFDDSDMFHVKKFNILDL